MTAEMVLISEVEGSNVKMQVWKADSDSLQFMVYNDREMSTTFHLHPDDCAPLVEFIAAFGGE